MSSERSSNTIINTTPKTLGLRHAVVIVILASAGLFAQSEPAAPSSAPSLEFPVIMRQNVAAGKTPVGAKIQAKLALATLVNGVVIPQDAILSGEVTESVAKSATDTSRLAIRIDSAQWKNGSAPLKVYLTPWYYPLPLLANQDLYESSAATPRPRSYNRAATYPDPSNPSSQPFPDRSGDNNNAGPASPESPISQHRVLMKNVEALRQADGAVTLTSKHLTIKLDKTTTYVFANGDLLPAK